MIPARGRESRRRGRGTETDGSQLTRKFNCLTRRSFLSVQSPHGTRNAKRSNTEATERGEGRERKKKVRYLSVARLSELRARPHPQREKGKGRKDSSQRQRVKRETEGGNPSLQSASYAQRGRGRGRERGGGRGEGSEAGGGRAGVTEGKHLRSGAGRRSTGRGRSGRPLLPPPSLLQPPLLPRALPSFSSDALRAASCTGATGGGQWTGCISEEEQEREAEKPSRVEGSFTAHPASPRRCS